MSSTRLLLLFVPPVLFAGCYLSHPPADGARCGAEICAEGEQCCRDCDGARCVTLDLRCPPVDCDGCMGNGDCGPTEYCALPTGACGGAGACMPRPAGCRGDGAPVCGCDGGEYPNECEAARAGVNIARFGPCFGEDFCGDDVCTDDEVCCSLCEGDGVCVPAGAPCPDVMCSGCFDSSECGVGELCSFPPLTCSGPGMCVPVPTDCEADCPGVCGCDGETYCNECRAMQAGVSVTDPSGCMTRCGRGGELCLASEYCDLGPGCGAGDAQSCAERPVACSDVVDPVCGCDGHTYGNACWAAVEGATVRAPGPCADP